MATKHTPPIAAEEKPPGRVATRNAAGGWPGIAGAALAAFALFFIVNCRTALDPRVANPNVQGRPRPVRFTFGLDYITFLDVATAICPGCAAGGVHPGWRRNPGSPVMLMFPVHHADPSGRTRS